MPTRVVVTGKKTESKGPTLSDEKRVVQLKDISVGDASGHRALDPLRVASLKQLFLDGCYGQSRSLLRGPGIVKDRLDSDGLHILEDGKATIVALKECQQAPSFNTTSFSFPFVIQSIEHEAVGFS